MKKVCLTLALALIVASAGAQTLIDAAQIRNVNGSVVTGQLATVTLTNAVRELVQYGSCTNGQRVTFSPVFTVEPTVTGTWRGIPSTAAGATCGPTNVLYIAEIATNQFRFLDGSGAWPTNKIYWTARGTTK